MFPLRDTIRSRSVPIVNYGLIALNLLIFLFTWLLGTRGTEQLLSTFGMVPANLSLVHPLSFVTLLTSMFLHGGWFHVISNMWILFIFGDNVEDRMGSGRYLAFYLICGLAAGLTHVLFSSGSQVPTVGASGAIAGVLGAYFVLFPRARVTTLILLFLLPWFVDIPAVFFIGFWFLTQLLQGVTQIGAVGDFGGIAWWAHVGGFVVGFALVRAFVRRPRVQRIPFPEERPPW